MTKALIVGGGIGGLTLAALLEKRWPECQVLLVEQTRSWEPLGAGITLTGNAMRVLDQAGLAEDVLAHGLPLECAHMADARGKVLLRAEAGDAVAGRDRWTGKVVAIHRAELHDVLRRGLESTEVLLGQTLHGVTTEGDVVRATIGDAEEEGAGDPQANETHEIDLVVGADGASSRVRDLILDGDTYAPRYSGTTCWRGVVDMPGSPAVQAAASWEIWAGARRFGVVPLPGERMYFYACIKAAENDPQYRTLDHGAFADLFQGIGGPVAEVLAAARRGCSLHHDDLSDLSLPRWHRDRTVLVGDAAHPMTPNLGQGAAMAMEDGLVLSEELARSPDDLPGALQRYEERRRPRVAPLVARAFQLGRMAHWTSAPVCALRNALLRMTPASVGLRQMRNMVDATL